MIQGAIFDMDGTLLDDMASWQDLGYEFIRMVGVEPTEELANRLAKMTIKQAVAYMRENYELDADAGKIERKINDIVMHRYYYEYPLKAGAKELLERLKAEGVKMCVATSTAQKLAMAALARCGVLEYFEAVLSSDMVGSGKTTPRIYRIALDLLGTPKEKTLVLEDVIFALRVAKEDGFLTAAVYDSNEKDQEGMRSEADLYITDLADTDRNWDKLKAL